MRRLLATSLAATVLLAAASAQAFVFVSGGPSRSGDLVGVWSKNGFELLVNLGPVDQLGAGPIASIEVPDEFGGDLIGAKFTALAVPNPDRLASGVPLNPPPPESNIVLTTTEDPARITWQHVGDAQAVLDPASGGVGWLKRLGSIPAADGSTVVVNTADEAVISASIFASYAINVGFSTDAVANTLAVSTATIVDEDGFEIPLYEVVQTYQASGPNFILGTRATEKGNLTGDNGESGLLQLALTVPEPGQLAGSFAVMGALGLLASRRRAALR